MSTVRFTVHCSAAVVKDRRLVSSHDSAFSVSKIRTIHAGIANSAHQPRCASCSTGRLPSRAASAESATNRLPIAAKSSPTTSSQGEWEQHDGMIIRITSRLYIEGAMEKKDPRGADNNSSAAPFQMKSHWQKAQSHALLAKLTPVRAEWGQCVLCVSQMMIDSSVALAHFDRAAPNRAAIKCERDRASKEIDYARLTFTLASCFPVLRSFQDEAFTRGGRGNTNSSRGSLDETPSLHNFSAVQSSTTS